MQFLVNLGFCSMTVAYSDMCVVLRKDQKRTTVHYEEPAKTLNKPKRPSASLILSAMQARKAVRKGANAMFLLVTKTHEGVHVAAVTMHDKSGNQQSHADSTLVPPVQICSQPCMRMRSRGGAHMEKCGRGVHTASPMVMSLQLYTQDLSPYEAGTTPQGWWQLLAQAGGYPDLVKLGTAIADAVPHAASLERIFSLMGWLHSKLRNRQSATPPQLLSRGDISADLS